MLDLSTIINDEQLLNLALENVARNPNNETAMNIVLWYIINDFGKNKQSFTQEDIELKYRELVASYVCEEMVKKDLIDVNFDENGNVIYQITQKGRNLVNEMDNK